MSIDELLDRTLEYLETGDERLLSPIPETKNPHGRVVDYRFEAFHDVIEYEDGHIEYFPIGD